MRSRRAGVVNARRSSDSFLLADDRAARWIEPALALVLALGVVHCATPNPSDGGGDANDVTSDATMDVAIDTTPEAAAPSVVHFELPASGPIDWGAVGFPSDLYRSADGHIELGALPVPEMRRAAWEPVRQHLQLRSGFCVGCSAFFRIDGDLDAATVPHDALPGDRPTASDALILMDIDAASTERGQMIPLRVQWRLRDGLLGVRPVRGMVLRPRHEYALIVTSRIHGADGTPLRASPLFASLRDGDTSADPSLARARTVLGPALDAVAAAGVARANIVGLAAFTTDDVTRDQLDLARILTDSAVPRAVAAVDRSWTTRTALDDLFGLPSMPGLGADIPAQSPTVMNEMGVAHDHVAAVVTGRFQAPRVIGGTGAQPGMVLRDAMGSVQAGPLEEIPFVLSIPTGADLATLPVAVILHGGADSRVVALAFAEALGRQGIAALGIDLLFHGNRSAHPVDARNALRRIDAQDGMAETNQQDAVNAVGALDATQPELVGSIGFLEGLFIQVQADAISTVRFARTGDVTAIRAVDPSLASLAFDPSRVGLVGISMGAAAQSVLVADSGAASAAMLIAGGSFADELAESALLRPLYEPLFFANWGIPRGLDESAARLILDPRWDLARWSLDRLEPISVARNLYREPVATGARPDLLLQWGDLDEEATPPGSDALASAAGIPGVGTFPFAPVAAAGALPLQGNLSAGTEAVTGVAIRYENATHNTVYIRNATSNVMPPLVPPFMRRATPIPIQNPVDRFQTQLAGFIASGTAATRATLSAAP